MLDKTATILTRVVLIEKAPFWVDIFYDSGDYCGTYLVKACVSEDERPERVNFGDFNFFDCYALLEGERECKNLFDLFAPKSNCKRVKK